MLLQSDLLGRAPIAGSYAQHRGPEESEDAMTMQERSSCSTKERSKRYTGHFQHVNLVIYQPTKYIYALFRIHLLSYSSKYTIHARINGPWSLCHPVNLMSSHHYRQDQSMIAAKRTGKEPIVTTWPTPSDSLNVLPTKSSRRPSLSQSIFAQPQPLNNPSPTEGDLHNGKHSSNTWTSSSEHSDPPAEEDGKDDWKLFVQEYNRLAQRVISNPPSVVEQAGS